MQQLMLATLHNHFDDSQVELVAVGTHDPQTTPASSYRVLLSFNDGATAGEPVDRTFFNLREARECFLSLVSNEFDAIAGEID